LQLKALGQLALQVSYGTSLKSGETSKDMTSSDSCSGSQVHLRCHPMGIITRLAARNNALCHGSPFDTNRGAWRLLLRSSPRSDL